MKREKRYLSIIKILFLSVVCSLFTSCITINRIQEPQNFSSFIDPVCGMKVEASTAFKTDYNGRTYYFDTEECQKVFLKNPEKFVSGQMFRHSDYNMKHTGMGMGIGWAVGTMVTAMAIAMTTMIFWGHWR